MSDKIKYIKFKNLLDSPWQPPQRMKIAIESLAQSIQKDGLEQMPTVDRNGYIIDGHRRIAAMKLLGWEGHDLIVRNVEDNEGYHFRSANTNRLKMTGNMEVYTYAQGGAINPRTKQSIEELIAVYGTDLIEKLLDKGANPTTVFKLYTRIRNYIDFRGVSSIDLLDWIFMQSIYTVRRSIEEQIPKRLLKSLIKENTPIPSIRGASLWKMVEATSKKAA